MEFHEIEIESVVEETADARSFELAIPPALSGQFGYRAGQFLTFEVEVAGQRLVRCYSLSSCPATDARPKVTVKRIADGRVSGFLNDTLRAGDRVRVMPPAGRFVLRDGEDPLLMFAGGSGITPVISLIKQALVTSHRRIRLVYANADRDAAIFREELDALRASHADRFDLRHHIDAERGLLDETGARSHADGFLGADAYVCGPGAFMDVVERSLVALGWHDDRILIERFVSPPDGEVPQVVLSPDELAASPNEILVHLDGESRRIAYRPGQSVLEAAQAAGMDPPFACTEGYCGTCSARLLSGEVKMAANDVFSDREVAAGHVLTCQARVLGAGAEFRYDD